jgi:hypothetical protein
VISKTTAGKPAAMYRFALKHPRKTQVLEKVTDLPTSEPVTAAGITRDASKLAVLCRGMLNIYDINGKIESAADVTPRQFPIPPVQAEGCCFTDDGIVIVAETGEIYLIPLPTPAATQPTH